MISRLSRDSCLCRFSSLHLVSGFHQLVDQGGGGGEAHRHPPLAGGETECDMGLVGPAVPDGDDVLSSVDVLAPGQLDDQVLVHRRDGQEANRELVEGSLMALLRQLG